VARTAVLLFCAESDAAHHRAPVLDIDELVEASSFLHQPMAAKQMLRGGGKLTAVDFQKEEIAIELQENEDAIERRPEVVPLPLVQEKEGGDAKEEDDLSAQQLFLNEEADIERQSKEGVVLEEEQEQQPEQVKLPEQVQTLPTKEDETKQEDDETTKESFLKEEAEIERQLSSSPQRRQRSFSSSPMENLNQKTHRTSLGAFYHHDPTPNRAPTETTGKHTNKLAQEMYFEEDLIDQLYFDETVIAMSVNPQFT